MVNVHGYTMGSPAHRGRQSITHIAQTHLPASRGPSVLAFGHSSPNQSPRLVPCFGKVSGFHWKSTGNGKRLFNKTGPIPLTYDQLINIPGIDQVHRASPVQQASYASLIKSIYQGADILLIRMTRLLQKVAKQLQHKPASAVQTLRMAQSFNQTLITLSRLPGQTGGYDAFEHPDVISEVQPHLDGQGITTLHIEDSPNYKDFLAARQQLDNALITAFKGQLEDVIQFKDLGTPLGQLHHIATQLDHGFNLWYNQLKAIPVPGVIPPYQQLICPDQLKTLTDNLPYGDETLINEFRAAHMVMELMAMEMNDHVHEAENQLGAYTLLKSHDLDITERFPFLETALKHIRFVNTLFPVMNSALDNFANHLSYAEYRKFRANLGLISGGDSFQLRMLLKKSPKWFAQALTDT